jgi:tetratricopeptide (TPR) repeat protein
MSLRPTTWIPLVLVGISLLLFARIGSYDFVNFDDSAYFYENTHVTEGLSMDNFLWAFEIHGPSMWIPLTWLSHQTAVTLFGTSAPPHHWINLLLHTANIALLFYLLHRLTGNIWRAGLVAALFAVHPIHVESVAWITERKDVLSLFFILLSLLAYHRYTRSPSTKKFLVVVTLHLLAVMAKPLAVTVPCVMLLLDIWPLGRARLFEIRKLVYLVIEKLPLLLISAFASWMTILCQLAAGAIGGLESFPLSTRIPNAVFNYASYLRKCVFPNDLCVYYPYRFETHTLESLLALALLVSISLLCLLRARRQQPAALIGWLWFLGTLVPMIGLVQAGGISLADRYAYLPFVGLYITLVWLAAEAATEIRLPHCAQIALALSVLLGFGVCTYRQIPVWANSETLFTHALQVTPHNHLAHNNLGLAYREQGRKEEAFTEFKASLRANPNYVEALNNYGIAQAEAGKFESAISSFTQALAIKPEHVISHHNLAKSCYSLKHYAQAMEHFEKALGLRPEFAQAAYDYAHLLMTIHQWKKAESYLLRVLELQPGNVNAWINLGVTHSNSGQMDAAKQAYLRALQIAPDNQLAAKNLNQLTLPPTNTLINTEALSQSARELREQGNLNEAINLYRKIVQLEPNNADAHNDLGVTLGMQGQHSIALYYFRRAIELNPNDSLAHRNKAAAEAALLMLDPSAF